MGNDKRLPDDNNNHLKNNIGTSSQDVDVAAIPSSSVAASTSTPPEQQLQQPPNNNQDDTATTQTQQHDMERATQNSLRSAVGAFPIPGPGGSVSESNNAPSNNNNNNTNPNNSSGYNSSSAAQFSGYSNDNLPPNIDIIAEATLVPNTPDDDPYSSNGRDSPVSNAMDTLGLRWDEEANLGGADPDTASVAISAISNPSFLPIGSVQGGSRSLPPVRSVNARSPQQQQRRNTEDELCAHFDATVAAQEQQQQQQQQSTANESIANNDSIQPSAATTSTSIPGGGGGDNGTTTTTIATEAIHATPIDDKTILICGRSFQFTKWHWLTLGLIVLAIIIVPTAVVLSNNPNSYNWTREEIEAIVSPSISSPQLLAIPNSPQSKAIDWLTTGGGTTILTGPTKQSLHWRIQQRYILAVLYYTTNGPTKWRNQYDYLDNEKHECDWGGMLNNGWKSMDCNEEEEVKLINLWQNNLSGSIPSELAQLENLMTIDFLTNSLTGTVPDELFTRTDMTYLNLGYNDLEGTISTKFGDLTKLTYLMIDDNDMTGTIPSELGNLKELSGWLSLEGNNFVGTVPKTLAQLTKASWIYLNYNDLTGSVEFMCDALRPKEAPNNMYANTTSLLLELWADRKKVECSCCNCCPQYGEDGGDEEGKETTYAEVVEEQSEMGTEDPDEPVTNGPLR